jgi:cell division protein FtsI/penicillin-binding protein 2
MSIIPTNAAVPLARRRAGWLVTLVGIAWLVIVGRMVQLQVWDRSNLADRAQRQREVAEDILPRPGDIFDSHGRLLATTVRTRSLYIVPSHISKPWSAAQQLAAALDMTADELLERIGRHADKHFLWIKRRLSDAEVERLRTLELRADQWGYRDEFRRVYPQGAIAAHVIGLRDIDGVGRGGVEEGCDDRLRGRPGRRMLARDALGRVIDVRSDPDRPAIDGESITLTLDTVVQLFVERELDRLAATWKPESCCSIVLEPHTGAILAMASRPAFDPNDPSAAAADAWKNSAVADIYEPGSTIKPCFVAYGLDLGLLRTDDQFHCEHGRYRMGRRWLHDHHPYGTLSLTDVLVKSSNIGMAKIGERLTNEHLHAAAAAFGFGRKTGIELPGELSGILRPLEDWTSYSTGSIPMGHELAVTPLQLITAHATLANAGARPRPRLVRGATSQDDWQRDQQPVVDPEVARWLVAGPMREVITRGTGRKAQIAGYEVFGKTGTAQSLSPSGGYRHGRYISSFVCGAPVDQPRVLVLVVVNQATEGGEAFGGTAAAPVAAEILRQTLVYLRVSPGDAAPSVATPNAPTRR